MNLLNLNMKRCPIALAALLVAACTGNTELTKSGLSADDFAAKVGGAKTALYTLTNPAGAEVCITNFGGRVVSLCVPDRDGNLRDVVLGFDNIDDYINVPSDFGAAVGRYANRINQGRFTLDGVEYDLPKNNFGHCLHGGPDGWQYRVYTVEEKCDNYLKLRLDSADGDACFPGNVTAFVTYTLTDDNELVIAYEAETDAPTVINMTNHSYFNLSGNPEQCICDDILYVNASNFTPVDDTFMTTGEIAPVAGTPMDFTSPKRIGDDIDCTEYVQIANGDGYDHNWVLDTHGDLTVPAAVLVSPDSGIVLTVYTDEPGVQVYSGNFLDGTVKGKHGMVYNRRSGICLETQHYPDTPNKPAWPSAVLRPGEKYESTCIYAFSTDHD